MKKYTFILIQTFIVVLCFPILFMLGKVSDPLSAFILSLIAYWSLIVLSSLYLVKMDNKLSVNLKKYLGKSNSIPISLLSLIPVVAVFVVAFLPEINNLNMNIVIIVLIISFFNGLFEEVFWRGLVLSKFRNNILMIIYSTTLFTILHFAFLFLPIEYDGGALSLVGGAAFMGFIWVFVSRKTNNIIFSIAAHQLVNFFAFSSLFIMNGMI